MEQTRITAAIAYIEEHLREELDNRTLARIAGYSEFHFIREFRKYVRLTPADYIRKRRISEIVRRIGEEKRPLSDIAFEYGFNSKENFTRAFKSEHGILPTEWKSAGCSLRLFLPFSPDRKKPQPSVSMQYIPPFTLTAYPFDNAFPPECWNRYNAEKRSARLSGGRITEDFGAMIWDSRRNCLLYHIGIRAEDALGNTDGTVQIAISGGLYAVFDTPQADQHTFVSVIRDSWNWIYREWLPTSGYRRGDGYELESYTETSRKFSERIYVPLRKE
ncbi:MAG: AraC family transcriptional regulator [Ruminococcaceae bacterium]|nr:AraC family transcriptional regulator [Oscillospiraceae bacterium]